MAGPQLVGFQTEPRTEQDLIALHTDRVRKRFEIIVSRVMMEANAALIADSKKAIVAGGSQILLSTNGSELDGQGKHATLEKKIVLKTLISGVFSVPCVGELRMWKRFTPFAWEPLVVRILLPYEASIDQVKNLKFKDNILPTDNPITISIALPEEKKSLIIKKLQKDDVFVGAVTTLTASSAHFS